MSRGAEQVRSLMHAEDRMLEGVPPVVALGFRPFFLAAAFMGVVWLPLWLAVFTGVVPLPSHFGPLAWHAHEMLFGYTAAVIAGFLLTAARNWTRLPTLHGLPLAGLALLWLAGRAVVLFGQGLPWAFVMAVDVAFLVSLAGAVGRPILRAGSRRNAGIPLVLLAMAAANAVLHLAAAGKVGPRAAQAATWLMLDGVTVLMVLIGGRIIPMFTANSLGRDAVPRRERSGLDHLGLALIVLLAVLELLALPPIALAGVAAAAGAAHLGRLVGWGSHRTLRTPLLWVLHLAWMAIGVGLWARAASEAGMALPSSVSVHLLTVGGIGLLTLGMMARVSLGHTGRPLRAPPVVTAAFLMMAMSAVVRTLAPIGWPGGYMQALVISGVAWSVAFLLFLLRYAAPLIRPRVDGRPG